MGSATVLIIGPTPPPFHGVAVAVQTLLDSSLSEKFQLSHLELADRRGIQYVNKPDVHDVMLFVRQWLRLVGMLVRIRPTVTYLVLSQSTVGFIRDSFLVWPAWLSGSRLAIHLHGGNFQDWFQRRSWIMKAYVRTVLGCVTRMIVLGESLKGQFVGLVPESQMAVVSNGVDWKRSGASVRPIRQQDRFRILHLSTLSHLKGALVLIKAIPLVLKRRQDVEFMCAGPWSHAEDKQWAERFIEDQGIEKYVCFPGQVDGGEKAALFESADLFVFPGIQQEGQPLVVLEAMAAGLPVIFTNRGCLRDTVVEGEAGVEVPINDHEALAEKILWMIDHPMVMKEMGQQARARYETFYTKDRHIERMTAELGATCRS